MRSWIKKSKSSEEKELSYYLSQKWPLTDRLMQMGALEIVLGSSATFWAFLQESLLPKIMIGYLTTIVSLPFISDFFERVSRRRDTKKIVSILKSEEGKKSHDFSELADKTRSFNTKQVEELIKELQDEEVI